MKAIWWWLYLFNIYISRTWNAGLLCYIVNYTRNFCIWRKIYPTHAFFKLFPNGEKPRLATDQVYKISAINSNAILDVVYLTILDFRRPP